MNGTGNHGNLKSLRKAKKALELDTARESSVLNEPSGWGELPSPKPSDADNGTELWGVPPDVSNREREKAQGGGTGRDVPTV